MKEKENIWKFEVKSYSYKNDLTDEQLDIIFSCFKNEDYQNFRNEIKEKDKKYDEFPSAKWQLQKASEIEELWHNNLDYTIDENVVNSCVNLEISFPESFDKDDVLIWMEGFGRLNRVYLMVQMDEITKDNNYHVDRNENIFLNSLEQNQKFYIKKI